MEPEALIDAIHDALVHLYDLPHLRSHLLASRLVGETPMSERGLAMHRSLQLAIERLRPPTETPEHALAWRHYRYLTLRYVNTMLLRQAAAELGITERHCRRVHKEALEALAGLLFGATADATALDRPLIGSLAGSPSDQQLLESELSRVSLVSEPPISLSDTIRSIASTLEALARAAGVTLHSTIETSIQCDIDRVVIRQALLSLLVHAIQACPGGKIAIAAGGHPSALSLTIDIYPSRAAGAPPTSPDDDNLQIAQRLISTHGGALTIQRTPHEIRYTITFPGSRLGTVLAIDDNPDLLRLFRRYLEGHAIRVLEARSAEEALQLAQSDRPDLITLDILLPHRDGWEILQLLKNHRVTRQIPVIVCSVLRHRDLAFSLGASEFLVKPVTQAALLAAIERCSESLGAGDATTHR